MTSVSARGPAYKYSFDFFIARPFKSALTRLAMIVPLPGGPTVHPTVWVRSLGSEIETNVKRLKKTLLHASTEPEQSSVRQKAMSPRENGSRQLHDLQMSRRAAQALQDAAESSALDGCRFDGDTLERRGGESTSLSGVEEGAGPGGGRGGRGVHRRALFSGCRSVATDAACNGGHVTPRATYYFSSLKIALMAGEV